MKTLTVIGLCLLISCQLQMVYAQDNYTAKDIKEDIVGIGGRLKTKGLGITYEGSPYLNDDYMSSEIYCNNQSKYLEVALRYNVFTDEMEFKHIDSGKIFTFKPNNSFYMIIIAEDTFIVSSYEKEKNTLLGFFKLVAMGKATLLTKYEMEFEEAHAATTHSVETDAKFKKAKDTYYLKMEDGPAVKIGSAKKLIECFGNHKNELSSYIKNEKISTKKENELKQLVDYSNSL